MRHFSDIQFLTKFIYLQQLRLFLLLGGMKNPFIVQPSYNFWAPWIGIHTRSSDMVLNTEYAKLHVSQDSREDDIPLTEERLADELLNLRV